MSISPFVLIALGGCWVLPALLIAVKYSLGYLQIGRARPETGEAMKRKHRLVEVEMRRRTPGRLGKWAEEKLPAARSRSVRSRVSGSTDSIQNVAVITPYAEISVSVYDSRGEVSVRRCSLCLN